MEHVNLELYLRQKVGQGDLVSCVLIEVDLWGDCMITNMKANGDNTLPPLFTKRQTIGRQVINIAELVLG